MLLLARLVPWRLLTYNFTVAPFQPNRRSMSTSVPTINWPA